MNELLREIQEDIRTENAEKLWRNFGHVAIRASIAIVIGTVIAVVWSNYQKSQAMEETAKLITAIEALSAGDHKNAISELDGVAAKKDSVYGAIALLHKAQSQTSMAQLDEAQKSYRVLGEQSTSAGNSAFVALAKLHAAQESDSPASGSSSEPFHFSRAEQQAWQLLKQGKHDESVAAFKALSEDDKAPSSLRMRAGSAVAYLTPLVKNKAE